MIQRRFLIGLAGAATLAFWAALVSAKQTVPSVNEVWVVVRPVQCLGNPWEKAWLSKHRGQVTKYPRDKEFDLMKSYFAKKGIPIIEMRIKRYMQGDPLCQTCDCPRGDVIYLKILSAIAPKMVELGYTDRMPVKDVPLKK